MTLRLNCSAHHPKRHAQLTVFQDHRRNDGVKRSLAGCQCVWMFWIQRKGASPVLEDNSCVARHYSRAERVEETVDERHSVSIFIDNCEVSRIASHIDDAGRR